MSHGTEEADIHVSTQRKKKEKKIWKHKSFLKGKLANRTKFRILFPSKRHCNILQVSLLVCFPNCMLVQFVYYLLLHFGVLQSPHWKSYPFCYRVWNGISLRSLAPEVVHYHPATAPKERVYFGQNLFYRELALFSCSFRMSQILRFHTDSSLCHWKVNNSD